MLSTASRYARTLGQLRAGQVWNRAARKLLPARPRLDVPPARRAFARPITWLAKPETMLPNGRLRLLNIEGEVRAPGDWNDPARQKLWLYTLHYLEGLLAPATDAETKASGIRHWLRDNPPGHGNGWEPYPLSLRIVALIKYALAGGSLPQGTVPSLAVQTRMLEDSLEYHLLGNHLFANAKALVFAGLFFTGPEANRWRAQGVRILARQIPEQFLADGGHFELSPTYHALLTEDLLDLIALHRHAAIPAPPVWTATAGRALAWLSVMTRPDGLPPLFNDAAYAITPLHADLVRFAADLGIEWQPRPSGALRDLPDTGYFRLDTAAASLFGDAGPIGPRYLPGHGHCDMLNFELFAHGSPIVVDTGTSTYDVGARRYAERGTAAHNSVQIGDAEQSEIWAAFRVGHRARIVERRAADRALTAAHDGFAAQGVIHRRTFAIEGSGFVLTDALVGTPKAQPRARLHFHPDVPVTIAGDRITIGPVTATLSGATRIAATPFDYAPEFNRRIPSICVTAEFDRGLELRLTP